jgi:hypothetical protein
MGSPYLCVIPGVAAIIERAGQARHAAGIWGSKYMYVGPHLCVIPGAAAIIERAVRRGMRPASEVVHECRPLFVRDSRCGRYY